LQQSAKKANGESKRTRRSNQAGDGATQQPLPVVPMLPEPVVVLPELEGL
jgi:hypothetical protein